MLGNGGAIPDGWIPGTALGEPSLITAREWARLFCPLLANRSRVTSAQL